MKGSLNLLKTEVFSSNLLPLLTPFLLLLGLFFKVLESPFLLSLLTVQNVRGHFAQSLPFTGEEMVAIPVKPRIRSRIVSYT